MRIERLCLDFFGQFTGKVLDFGPAGRASDFHLIYGPNEAGKTTTMEGYLRLLYGFAHREPYAFQHQRRNLQVSGTLDVGGERRCFTRMPSQSANLRGEAGETLPETAIAAHLGGLSLDDYRSLLCLDDETIEKGGEDIANARGDVGRLLFSAAAGVADLNAVLDETRGEAGTIYKRRASTTRVAELKRALAEVESAIRESDISASAWRKLKEALRQVEEDEREARRARDTLREQQARIAAMRRALPNLSEHDGLRDEIAAFDDYPASIDINPEALVAMLSERGQAAAELRRLEERRDATVKARDALVVDDERLALGERLEALDELRSRMQTAALDLPRRERSHREALADMARVAADLDAPEDCDAATLITSQADIAGLEALRDRVRETAAARDNGAREVAALKIRLADAMKAERALAEVQPAATGLSDLLGRFDADRLAPDVSAARQSLASTEEALQEALDRLAVGSTGFATLPESPVDPITALERAARHDQLTQNQALLQDRLSQLEEDIAVMTIRTAALSAEIGVGGDEQAQAARAERDALWQTHRSALTAETADRFAAAMTSVDQIDAARIALAAGLGTLRKLTADLAEAEARAEAMRQKRHGLAEEIGALLGEAETLAAGIGLPPLSPAALSDWVARHAAAAEASRRLERCAAQHAPTRQKAEDLLQALEPLVGLEAPDFDAALSAARRLADAERAEAERLRTASEKTAGLREEVARRQSAQTALQASADEARHAWQSRIDGLYDGKLSADRLAEALGHLRALREHDARRLQAARQIATMKDDQRRFADAIGALGEGFGVEAGDPLEVYRRLKESAAEAHDAKARHRQLVTSLEEYYTRAQQLKLRVEEIDRQVGELGAVFPKTVDTATLEALRAAVGRARDVIAKRAQVARLERLILDDLSLETMSDARAALQGKTAAALEAKADTLATDLGSADERLSAATVARANAARDLAAVTGGAEVAELVAERSTLQLQIEEAILDYLELQFGLRSAKEAIRRYRDTHRSQMMAATEQAFAALTNGAYLTLRTQADGASEILLAVDRRGTPKQIGDMSKGTRFQLYLALRAAAYEQMVSQGVQLPFFCDDVFETFDEDRTRAACRLMERIGRSGQAIYLTHHRHVVEIAEQVCDEPPLIHAL
ncbi:MAG: AAA family ATPase [Pseudomonadota bacterium]